MQTDAKLKAEYKQGYVVKVVLSVASRTANTCVQSSFNSCICALLPIKYSDEKRAKLLTKKSKLSTKYLQWEMNEGNGYQLLTIGLPYLQAKFQLQIYFTS